MIALPGWSLLWRLPLVVLWEEIEEVHEPYNRHVREHIIPYHVRIMRTRIFRDDRQVACIRPLNITIAEQIGSSCSAST